MYWNVFILFNDLKTCICDKNILKIFSNFLMSYPERALRKKGRPSQEMSVFKTDRPTLVWKIWNVALPQSAVVPVQVQITPPLIQRIRLQNPDLCTGWWWWRKRNIDPDLIKYIRVLPSLLNILDNVTVLILSWRCLILGLPMLYKWTTVKLVCKDHPWGPTKCGPYTQVVFICRFNSMESIHLGTCKMRLYKQVVFIYRVFLEKVWL